MHVGKLMVGGHRGGGKKRCEIRGTAWWGRDLNFVAALVKGC